MTPNTQTSRSYLLDALEGIVNLIAATSHIREGIQDLSEEFKISGDDSLSTRIEQKKEQLKRTNSLRRKAMDKLKNTFGGKISEWCTTKHYAYPFVTFWESYDATSDEEWLELALEATGLFVEQVALFLNIDPSELGGCMRCLGDSVYAKEI